MDKADRVTDRCTATVSETVFHAYNMRLCGNLSNPNLYCPLRQKTLLHNIDARDSPATVRANHLNLMIGLMTLPSCIAWTASSNWV